MEVDEIAVIEMELKYCERCGGLGLRVQGSEQAYCEVCAPIMSEHAISRKRRSPRLPVGSGVDVRDWRGNTPTVCNEGGNA